MGPQLVLQYRTEGPGLDEGGAADGVDLQDAVHRGQVERQHGAVGVAPVLHPADHRGPAAERNDGHPVRTGPVEQVGHLPVAGRAGDQVRDPARAAAQGAGDVAVGLAHGVGGAVAGIVADEAGQGGRGCHGGPADGEVGDPGDRQRAGQGPRQQGAQCEALGVVGLGVLIAPAPPGPEAGGVLGGRRHEAAPGVR